MKAKVVLITGSSGLIGSEAVAFFCEQGWKVHGIDNNMRLDFFGVDGDTSWNERRLKTSYKDYPGWEVTKSLDDIVLELLKDPVLT